MNKYVKRLIILDSKTGNKINPLLWPFAIGTLLYGVGFAFLNLWSGANNSSLYEAMNQTSNVLPEVWGIFAAAASVLCIAFLASRQTWVGQIAAFLGFNVWLYAGWVYYEQDKIVVALGLAGVNAYFWAWLYLRTMKHKRDRAAGIWVDPH